MGTVIGEFCDRQYRYTDDKNEYGDHDHDDDDIDDDEDLDDDNHRCCS